jgi:hypothetical protein
MRTTSGHLCHNHQPNSAAMRPSVAATKAPMAAYPALGHRLVAALCAGAWKLEMDPRPIRRSRLPRTPTAWRRLENHRRPPSVATRRLCSPTRPPQIATTRQYLDRLVMTPRLAPSDVGAAMRPFSFLATTIRRAISRLDLFSVGFPQLPDYWRCSLSAGATAAVGSAATVARLPGENDLMRPYCVCVDISVCVVCAPAAAVGVVRRE